MTYSNKSKQELLGVRADLIAAHGAVSADVAEAMALGALERSRAQLALSITGIAGPDGGTADKPVGTVHFAVAQTRTPDIGDIKAFSRAERQGAFARRNQATGGPGRPEPLARSRRAAIAGVS